MAGKPAVAGLISIPLHAHWTAPTGVDLSHCLWPWPPPTPQTWRQCCNMPHPANPLPSPAFASKASRMSHASGTRAACNRRRNAAKTHTDCCKPCSFSLSQTRTCATRLEQTQQLCKFLPGPDQVAAVHTSSHITLVLVSHAPHTFPPLCFLTTSQDESGDDRQTHRSTASSISGQ